MSRPRRPDWLVLTVVAFGVFVAADDLTVVTTMLRPMVVDFGLSLPDGFDEAAWIVDAYLIGYVAIMPLAGRVSDAWGRRNVFVGAFVVFALGSLIVPLTDSYAVLLAGRVLSAIGGGAMVPVGLAIVSETYQGRRRTPAIGVLGAIDTLGWVWGPLFGAMLIRYLSWEWQFYLNVPLAVAGAVAAWMVIPARPAITARVPGWRGALGFTVALAAVNAALLESSEIQSVTGLDELTGVDRSLTLPLLLLAGLGAVVYVWSERNADEPLFPVQQFRDRSFSAAMAVNFALGASLVIAMVNVPLFVNVIRRVEVESALVSGRVLSALTATMAVFALVGGRAAVRFGHRAVTGAGLAVAAGAYLVMWQTWNPAIGEGAMALQLAVLGIGFGLATAPSQAAAVEASDESAVGSSAGLVLVFRLVGLSVGLAGLTAWGLARFNDLRARVVLPDLADPGFEDALAAAQADITSMALSETFAGAALLAGLGVVAAWWLSTRGWRSAAQSDLEAPAASGE